MKFVLATGNIGKIREMRALLEGFEVTTPAELGIAFEPEETGETFRENALIKARAACALTGLPAIADDSGLCVDALGGAPGVHSARYSVPGDRKAKLLRELDGIKRGASALDRRAKFVSAIACVFPSGDTIEAAGECAGEIAREPRGDGGFGYDPIFYLPEWGRTMAELPSEIKNAISHRARAMQAFSAKLNEYTAECPPQESNDVK
jgi:XTP/dITP diphosphohydrolase